MAQLLGDSTKDFTQTGFVWALDKAVPKVRNNSSPYKKAENFVAVVDGFPGWLCHGQRKLPQVMGLFVCDHAQAEREEQPRV